MSDKDILQKVLENTEVIKKSTLKLQEQLDEVEEKNETRKEQLKKAQKSFKKIGCNIKIELANKFEELAHKLNYSSTSSMCRTYLMLLLENEEYQKTFIEFATIFETKERRELEFIEKEGKDESTINW